MNLGFGISNLFPFESNSFVDSDGAKIYKAKMDKNYIKYIKVSRMIQNGLKIEDISDNLICKPQKLEYESEFYEMLLYVAKLISLKKYNDAIKIINDSINNSKISNKNKINMKISLIDCYLYLGKFEKIIDIYDEEIINYLILAHYMEQSACIYLYLYYVILGDSANFTKYFELINKYLKFIKETDLNQYNDINDLKILLIIIIVNKK